MSLKEELGKRKREIGFVPVAALDTLVTVDSVQQLVSDRLPQWTAHDHDGFERSLARALPRARKLIAVLVLSGLEEHIPYFVSQGISDDVFRIQDLRMFAHLDVEARARIRKEQWTVPPILSAREHFYFQDGTILPFSEMKVVNHGSYGIVHKLKVAEGHLECDWPGYRENSDIALKEIEVRKGREESVMAEVVALRRLDHPNIVPLLASFTDQKTESGCEVKFIGMLFPYAEMDMEDWLYRSKTPKHLDTLSRSERRRRLYCLMQDLVSALAAIHRGAEGLVASHHDLKPRNILVVENRLMIADLGMAELVSLAGAEGGSAVSGAGGIGTEAYRPPEYYKAGSWQRDETRRFGRAFDMWAMGCIMLQVAVLIVWGWESTKIDEFRRARESFLTDQAKAPQTTGRSGRLSPPGDSFVKSGPVVDEWLMSLQAADGSSMLQGYLAVAVQMLRADPLERVYSWEAELDLHELLHPDDTRESRSEKTFRLVQRPSPGGMADDAETPLHRAAAKGDFIRVIGLLEAGWSAQRKDKTRRTPSELAESNGHLRVREVLSLADAIKLHGHKHVLRGLGPEPLIHIREERGFRLLQHDMDASRYRASQNKSGRAGSVQFEENQGPEQNPNILRQDRKYGGTVLHEAARDGDVAFLESSLVGAEAAQAVILGDSFGMTPLHVASGTSAKGVTVILQATEEKIQLLLAKDQFGRIPLHIAVAAKKRDVVRALAQACPNKESLRWMSMVENHDGKTPLDVALRAGYDDVMQDLASLEATTTTYPTHQSSSQITR